VRDTCCSGQGEFWVEGDVVFFQEGQEFGVEGHFMVMGWLILDVAGDGGDAMWARLRTRLVSHLGRLGALLRAFPPLPRWASLCRASRSGMLSGRGGAGLE
jgi:hypothetical protein